MAPPGTPPRRYAYTPLTNINWTTRDGGIDFATLRRFSDYSIVRAIIESALDRVCSVNWEFRLIQDESEKPSEYKKRNASDKRIKALRNFYRKPDGWQNFRTWSRGLYDDMLVIDAASIWLQKDKKDKIASLVQIDGAQVFPLLDETGQQPDPGRVLTQTSGEKANKNYFDKVKAKGGKVTQSNGKYVVQGGSPAFQLTPYGYPAQEMTANELIYAVRNRKTYRKFGFAAVEQALAIIALGMARQDFQAAYYSAGNVPEFIAFLPPDVPVSKAEELNGYLDSILSGNLRTRRKGFFLPSYGSDKSPNIVFPKANDEVLKDSFDEWIARVLCFIIGISATPFIKQMNRATAQQQSEESEEQGLQPYLDWFGDLLNEIIQCQFGFEDIEAVTQTRKEQDALKQAEIDDLRLSKGAKTLNEIRDDNGDDRFTIPEADVPVIITATGIIPWDGSPLSNAPPEPTPDPNTPPPKGKKKQPKPTGKAEKADSRLSWPILSPGILTTKTHSARVRTEIALQKCFRGARDAAIRGLNGLVARPAKAKKLRKDDIEDDKRRIEQAIVAEVTPYFDRLPVEVRQAYEDAALSGVHEAVLQLSIDDAQLINSVNQQAADWARARAAELVGMAEDAEGNLVTNPDAKWAITETTREDLKQIITNAFEGDTTFDEVIAKIQSALRNERLFSDARAEMIARTEIGRAQMGSTFDVWKRSGLVAKLKWSCDGADPCVLCLMNQDAEVEFGDPFPSGAHSILESHPNCQCSVQAAGFDE